MNRKITLISDNIKKLLEKQMAHELQNFNIYLTYAGYFARQGYVKLEEYYRKRAAEEHNHFKWCYDYLVEADADFICPAVEAIPESYLPKTMLDPFEKTVDVEIATTQLIYAIKEAAMTEKDYMTSSWLSEHLIKEQVEEENTSRMAQSIAEQEDSWLEKAEEIYDLLK